MENLIPIFDPREPGFAPTTPGQLKDALSTDVKFREGTHLYGYRTGDRLEVLCPPARGRFLCRGGHPLHAGHHRMRRDRQGSVRRERERESRTLCRWVKDTG